MGNSAITLILNKELLYNSKVKKECPQNFKYLEINKNSK